MSFMKEYFENRRALYKYYFHNIKCVFKDWGDLQDE